MYHFEIHIFVTVCIPCLSCALQLIIIPSPEQRLANFSTDYLFHMYVQVGMFWFKMMRTVSGTASILQPPQLLFHETTRVSLPNAPSTFVTLLVMSINVKKIAPPTQFFLRVVHTRTTHYRTRSLFCIHIPYILLCEYSPIPVPQSSVPTLLNAAKTCIVDCVVSARTLQQSYVFIF